MEGKTVVVVKGIVIYKGKILLVKRAEESKVGAGTWEMAGGKLKFGEELEDALVREIKEETGIWIRPRKLLFASTINDDPSRQLVFLNYLCEADDDDVTLSDEHTDFVWATKMQLKELIAPEIFHQLENNHVLELEVLQ
ncbi:NUDIX hydrolase [Oceanobacillus halophilus]|uniref:NUDIX domain-containing protein n=1 Tax=Oceanobacillus halophilus TaxID=930130 RepID=A0A495A4Q1_9BACI|nr:NUDIX domain-containing protein [Oceanobacillus halophilus]RKQ33277.1 NUDIX domain-containing protein [Oceanobacillus halophilus]